MVAAKRSEVAAAKVHAAQARATRLRQQEQEQERQQMQRQAQELQHERQQLQQMQMQQPQQHGALDGRSLRWQLLSRISWNVLAGLSILFFALSLFVITKCPYASPPAAAPLASSFRSISHPPPAKELVDGPRALVPTAHASFDDSSRAATLSIISRDFRARFCRRVTSVTPSTSAKTRGPPATLPRARRCGPRTSPCSS